MYSGTFCTARWIETCHRPVIFGAAGTASRRSLDGIGPVFDSQSDRQPALRV